MPAAGDTSQTLSRGLDVLELLAASPTGRNPSQIAAELGLSRTIVYRLVGTLAEHGFVRRNSNGLLSIGLAALRLTDNIHPALREATHEILVQLAAEAGATAHFCIADGNDALAVAVVEPLSTTFHVAYRVGSRTPAGKGALGRAIQAAGRGEAGIFHSEGELIPGAKGVVAALPGFTGLPAAVGVVTLAGIDTARMVAPVERAAAQIAAALHDG